MKARDLREFTDEELRRKLGDLKEELFNLRFRAATGELDNSARIGLVKKDIARVLTIMRERRSGLVGQG